MGLCHSLPLPSEYEVLAQGVEHNLTSIFRLASVRNDHKRVAVGPHNYDKAALKEGDSDP